MPTADAERVAIPGRHELTFGDRVLDSSGQRWRVEGGSNLNPVIQRVRFDCLRIVGPLGDDDPWVCYGEQLEVEQFDPTYTVEHREGLPFNNPKAAVAMRLMHRLEREADEAEEEAVEAQTRADDLRREVDRLKTELLELRATQ